jgi:hypothetical protein
VNYKKIVLGTLLVGFLAIAIYWVRGQLVIDSCLDNGGRWNYKENMCESE